VGVTIDERLDWLGHGGEHLMEERRTIEVADGEPESRSYRIRTTFLLTNATAETLQFSSAAIKGRAKAGYGGYFWRGPGPSRAERFSPPAVPRTPKTPWGLGPSGWPSWDSTTERGGTPR
jgi:hypothetical protein